ncbi:hypothetical protein [Phenylobacterium sp. Root700]|uniref:hypothetical protein n=1 Tax=Phenylobacterium sp. Root700 TaxID=1736591 RepID=UPI0006FA30C9|nr:hypothetical protein [Phenylobacterium sp. Root700]KRB43169.1 hypothetical protein ASE02_20405 [Phenylobacterium sp. Root700]
MSEPFEALRGEGRSELIYGGLGSLGVGAGFITDHGKLGDPVLESFLARGSQAVLNRCIETSQLGGRFGCALA